jgi:intein-encoded DNA endonuclease-like protein
MNISHIPRDKAYYIVGFSDGEGSFNTSFRKRDDFLLGWKITPVFNISQKEKDILAIIKNHLSCGTLRPRKDGVWVFEVENKTAIKNTIIPFFKKYSFLSTKKKKDFYRFLKIVEILDCHKSTTFNDLQQILNLLDEIESKASRKYTNQEILERASIFWSRNQEKIEILNQKSSETTR